ncbi:MAG: terminase small subunit [Rikenellaceae bacterium]
MEDTRSTGGRPPVYTPDELWAQYIAYEKKTKDIDKLVSVNSKQGLINLPKERPLTIVGFCVFANISRMTFYRYENNGDEFCYIYTRIRERIEADQTEGAMLEIYNPTITARMLGLVERHSADVEIKKLYDQMTEEELLAELAIIQQKNDG